VSGDGRRFEPQDACVVIGEPIAVLGSHLASVLTNPSGPAGNRALG
jgi:hypothetical protein